jgi:heterodisulfide reductase subunit C
MKFHLPSENPYYNKNIDDSLEQSNIYVKKFFLQEFSEKERFEKNFCLYCGICTDIKDMDIL